VVTGDITHMLTWLPMTSHTCWHGYQNVTQCGYGYQWRQTRLDMVINYVTHVLTLLPRRYTRVAMVINDVTHVLTWLVKRHTRVDLVSKTSHTCWHGYQNVTHVLTWLVKRHTLVDMVTNDVTHVLTWLPRSYTRFDTVTSSIIHVFQWRPTRVAVMKLRTCWHGYL